MSIIIEGFDNSGKSTLVRWLQGACGFQAYHPGPRPQNDRAVLECIDEQLKLMETGKYLIFDRLTAFSHYCYGDYPEEYLATERQKFIDGPNLIIYCRPPMDLILTSENHVMKPYDTEESTKQLWSRAVEIIQKYDKVMDNDKIHVYDYTEHTDHYLWRLVNGYLSL